ncbi:MAG: DUF3179 domain-containing protein [Actinobacteria bacterium]|nr:MAG: DUF3179 domain-containing protein [Actinomycetota bacterium]
MRACRQWSACFRFRSPAGTGFIRSVCLNATLARTGEGRPIAAATAFQRRLEGRVLEFELRDGRYIDAQTGSEWNLLGEALNGPLKGRRLAQLESGVHFAFAWLAFNPQSEIVRSLP